MVVAAALLLAYAGPSLAAKPGQWEFTSDVNIPGLDPAQAASTPLGQVVGKHSFKGCVGSDGVPEQPPGTGQCTPSNIKSNGSVVTWHVECKTAQGNLKGDGKATYSGNNLQSSMDMTGDMGGLPLAMNVTTTGKYEGACAK
jgi:hypothetical protein